MKMDNKTSLSQRSLSQRIHSAYHNENSNPEDPQLSLTVHLKLKIC